MAPPTREDESSPRRPRWLAWAIGLFVGCIVLGMVNLAWLMLTGALGPTVDKGAAAPGARQATSAAARAVAPPAAASSCMRCHGVERTYVGPSFVHIAERYQGRADVQAYLAGKIVNGSVGEWGRVVMPRQVEVTDATAQQLAQWIVQLAPPPTLPAQDGGQRPDGDVRP